MALKFNIGIKRVAFKKPSSITSKLTTSTRKPPSSITSKLTTSTRKPRTIQLTKNNQTFLRSLKLI